MDQQLLEELDQLRQDELYWPIIQRIEKIPQQERTYELNERLITAYNNEEDYKAALELLTAISAEGEQDARWHFLFGFACYYLARYDQALAAFTQADRLKPEDEQTEQWLEETRIRVDQTNKDRMRYEQDQQAWEQQYGNQPPFSNFDLSSFWGNQHENQDQLSDTKVSAALDEQLILSVEQKLGYKLPHSYLVLINSQNGGIPARTAFPLPHSDEDDIHNVAIDSILGMSLDDEDSIDEKSRFMIEDWGYPDLGVVVCDCPSAGHDVIMLDYRFCGPQGEPCVIHVDQEDDYRITYLAPNFEVFIRGLEVEDYT